MASPIEKLTEAIKNGDAPTVEKILSGNTFLLPSPDPAAVDKSIGETPMHLACRSGHRDVAAAVARLGGRPFETAGDAPPALFVSHDSAMLSMLLNIDPAAAFAARDHRGRSVWHVMAGRHNPGAIAILTSVRDKTDPGMPSPRDGSGLTPLRAALESPVCSHDLVSLLLKAFPGDALDVAPDGQSAMDSALVNKRVPGKTISLLHAAGARPSPENTGEFLRRIPDIGTLSEAVLKNDIPPEASLAAAESRLTSSPPWPAAAFVIASGMAECPERQAMLDRALVKTIEKNCDPGLVENMIGAGADPSAAVDGVPSLSVVAASMGDNPAVLEKLLAAGADPDARSEQGGYSALACAVRTKSAACVNLLLSAGANPSGSGSENAWGPPLFIAAKMRLLGMLESLAEKGADTTASFGGETAAALALSAFGPAMRDVFEQGSPSPSLRTLAVVRKDGQALLCADAAGVETLVSVDTVPQTVDQHKIIRFSQPGDIILIDTDSDGKTWIVGAPSMKSAFESAVRSIANRIDAATILSGNKRGPESRP